MARPRSKIDSKGQAGRLLAMLEGEPPGWRRERLLGVKLALEGEMTLGEAASAVGRSRRTLTEWVRKFREGGLEALVGGRLRGNGPPSGLNPRARKELLKKVAKGSFRRAEDARGWLARRFGIEVGLGATYKYLKMCGASLKVPRPRNSQKDEAAAGTFKSTLARRIHTLGLPAGRPLRVWVADEARVGLHPVLRRCWVKRGCRAHKDSEVRYHWRYVWGALQVGGGGSEFLYSDGVDTGLSLAFLEQISQRDPWAVHVVVWDGAGFHPGASHPDIPENVRVLRQPPYSPELNPVEKLWDMLRDALANRRWEGIGEMLGAATRFLEGFWSDARNVSSLVGGGWMLNQANA